ncbi:hypothetical protein [Actinorugispora endophytica]|uniref:Uncharacterized protein n=1 Tax=Actinorugispora endophytica TaxID=1605990 RepID=A0A4V3D8Q3_9ACTN|nr:hypothetical protein [Actinorugispora endophytica]TDQ52469.1 hypothetical protein EV190_106107 [Actinorugispora endophytica]
MKTQPAVMVVVDIHVSFPQPVTKEEFHQRATRLMDELIALNECNDDIADPVVSSDAGESLLTVEVVVVSDDPFEATSTALTVLRTALHAAGAGTSGWPTVSRMENRAESLPDPLFT